MDASHPGGLGGTFGGNPVAAAAAVAVIEQIEAEDLLGDLGMGGDRGVELLVELVDDRAGVTDRIRSTRDAARAGGTFR